MPMKSPTTRPARPMAMNFSMVSYLQHYGEKHDEEGQRRDPRPEEAEQPVELVFFDEEERPRRGHVDEQRNVDTEHELVGVSEVPRRGQGLDERIVKEHGGREHRRSRVA